MKKFLFMFALMLGVVSANAQIATQNSAALDNVSVGVTAGVSTPLDFNSVFPLNTNLGIKLQKDFTTAFGVQIEGLAFLNDNHFSDISTAVKATNVGANGVFNLSNIFGGYNGTPRVFEVSTVTGIGWLHSWGTKNNFLTSKTGIDFAFNLGNEKAHSIVITPAIYWNLNKFGHVHFDKRGSQLAINVSYVYHFKTTNGTRHFKTYDVGAMIGEISRLNASLAECEKREPKVIERVVEVPAINGAAVKTGNEMWVVPFAVGESTLSSIAKEVLNQIGNDAIVDVTATASPDGPTYFNKRLSERRAAAVADYLTKRGVRVNSWAGEGVNPETGRSAIVKTIQ